MDKIISDKDRCILIPYDFTDEANFAIDHALLLIKTENLPIHILHVVKKKKEIEAAKEKLQLLVDNIKKEKFLFNVNFVIAVRKGNIYKQIYKYGIENGAYLAVMGTHGIKNIRKAMKVVKKFVRIPFILVQDPVKNKEFKNILLTIDTDKSQRIKAQWVNYLDKLFKSKAYIISHDESETYKVRDLRNNLLFIQEFFMNQNIDYEMKGVYSKKYFADEIYNYAAEINADIILLMTHRYRFYIKELRKSENLERYKQIPIMCVNKRTDILKLGGFG